MLNEADTYVISQDDPIDPLLITDKAGYAARLNYQSDVISREVWAVEENSYDEYGNTNGYILTIKESNSDTGSIKWQINELNVETNEYGITQQFTISPLLKILKTFPVMKKFLDMI